MKTVYSIGGALLSLGLASAPASATIYSLGALNDVVGSYAYGLGVDGALPIHVAKKSTLALNDEWTFTLSGPEYVSVGFNDSGNPPISSGVLSLVNLSSAQVIGSDSISPATMPQSAGIGSPNGDLLSAGSYAVEVTGSLKNGSSHADIMSYDGTISVSAVPEPATWGMMLLGFAGLGFAGYRQTRKSRAAFAAV